MAGGRKGKHDRKQIRWPNLRGTDPVVVFYYCRCPYVACVPAIVGAPSAVHLIYYDPPKDDLNRLECNGFCWVPEESLSLDYELQELFRFPPLSSLWGGGGGQPSARCCRVQDSQHFGYFVFSVASHVSYLLYEKD
jgi:hypothetical protein